MNGNLGVRLHGVLPAKVRRILLALKDLILSDPRSTSLQLNNQHLRDSACFGLFVELVARVYAQRPVGQHNEIRAAGIL
jgi:hypothetical protein